MEELYRTIEDKIRSSGYKGDLDGEDIYNELCDQIEDKEPGSYVFLCKKEGDTFFEYNVDVLEEQFNLSSLDIHTPAKKYHIDFDDESR